MRKPRASGAVCIGRKTPDVKPRCLRQRAEQWLSLIHILHMLSSSGAAAYADGCELAIQNSAIQIDYLSAVQVLTMCAESEDSHSQKAYAEQLLAGKEVMTDLGEYPFTTDPSSFVLLQPVSCLLYTSRCV